MVTWYGHAELVRGLGEGDSTALERTAHTLGFIESTAANDVVQKKAHGNDEGDGLDEICCEDVGARQDVLCN